MEIILTPNLSVRILETDTSNSIEVIFSFSINKHALYNNSLLGNNKEKAAKNFSFAVNKT